MLEKIKNLNLYYKTAVYSSILGIGLVIITCFLFFIGWMEIPLGFLVGLIIGIISHLSMGVIDIKNNKINSKGAFWSITVIILRLLILGAVLFLIGYLYYHLQIKIFNIFSTSGGYIFVTVILIILTIRDKGKSNG